MSLLKKMKIAAKPLWVLNMPDNMSFFEDEVDVHEHLRGKQLMEQVVLFAADSVAHNTTILKILPRLSNEVLLWVAYPKKSGSIKSDITRDNGWEELTNAGYIPVTQVSVDNDWTALRFRQEQLVGPKLRDTKMTERNVEGIDFVNRTVTLPGDVRSAFTGKTGLITFFEQMSFSHKKEYVAHIVTAKKPETRARRIKKMIDMLEQKLSQNNK